MLQTALNFYSNRSGQVSEIYEAIIIGIARAYNLERGPIRYVITSMRKSNTAYVFLDISADTDLKGC